MAKWPPHADMGLERGVLLLSFFAATFSHAKTIGKQVEYTKKAIEGGTALRPTKYRVQTKTMAVISAAALCITAVFGGTMAYMTNSQNARNTFTTGEVKVKLTEPDWPGNDSKETTGLTPNQEVAKNPQITNTGSTSAVVFAEVEIPIDEYDVAAVTGEKQGKAARELFWFKTNDTKIGTYEDTIHDGDTEWDWLQNLCYYKDAGGNFIDHAVAGGSAVHVFGYKAVLGTGQLPRP